MIRSSPGKRQWKNDIKRPRLEGLEVNSPSKNDKLVPNDVWENDFFSNSDVLQDLEVLSQHFEGTAIRPPNVDENGNKGNDEQIHIPGIDHSECQKDLETKSGEITYLRKKIEVLNETIKQKDKDIISKITENQLQAAKIKSLKISSHTPKGNNTFVAPISKPSTSKDPVFPSTHSLNESNHEKKQLTYFDPSEFVFQNGKILKDMKLDHLLSLTVFVCEDDDHHDSVISSVIPDIKTNLYNLYILDRFDNEEAKLVIKKILTSYKIVLSSLLSKFEKTKIKYNKKMLLKPQFINSQEINARYRLKSEKWFDDEENARVRILLAILLSISTLEASVLDLFVELTSETRFSDFFEKYDEIMTRDKSAVSLQTYAIVNFIRIQKTSYQNTGLLCAIIKLCTVMCSTRVNSRDLLIFKHIEQIVFSCPPSVVLDRLLKLLIYACKYEPKIISNLCRNSAVDTFVDNDSYFQYTMSSCVLQVFCVQIEFIKFRSVKFLENFSKFVKCILHFEKQIEWLHHNDGENYCECLDRFEQIIVTLSLDAVDRINSHMEDRNKLYDILVDTVNNLNGIQSVDRYFLTRVAAYNGDYVCLLNHLKRIFVKNSNIIEFTTKQLYNLRGISNSQQKRFEW